MSCFESWGFRTYTRYSSDTVSVSRHALSWYRLQVPFTPKSRDSPARQHHRTHARKARRKQSKDRAELKCARLLSSEESVVQQGWPHEPPASASA